MTVIGCLRGLCPQIIFNRLGSKPWYNIETSAFIYLKGIGDKYLFLTNWWEGAQSTVFDAQLFAPSLKGLHLLEESVAVMSLNVSLINVIDNQALTVDISAGGTR